MELSGKVALVTGASRRIGAAVAASLGRRGASVVVNYLERRDLAEQVAERVRDAGGEAIVHGADVRDRGAVRTMVARAVEAFGGIDILVNNARLPHPPGPFLEVDWHRDMRPQLDVHLGGAFHCCQAAIPHMQKRGGGAIVNMLTISFRRANPRSHAYSPAKAALRSLTLSLAAELGSSGIRVNSLSPGTTDPYSGDDPRRREALEETPLGRFATSEEIAEAAVFLCTDAARYITGADLLVSGGRAMTL